MGHQKNNYPLLLFINVILSFSMIQLIEYGNPTENKDKIITYLITLIFIAFLKKENYTKFKAYKMFYVPLFKINKNDF